MCVLCGCSETNGHKAPAPRSSAVPAAPQSPRVDALTGDLHFGAGLAKVSVPGMSEARAVRLEADVLGENSRLAAVNRAHFAAHGITAYDLVSSPGSGKTTLLCTTITRLMQRIPHMPVAVIEGDQQTSLDADRIRRTGISAIQVNTGKGCHLDAPMVAAAFERLSLHADGHHSAHALHQNHENGADHIAHAEHAKHAKHAGHAGHAADGALLLIENVGNLVCPAMWDLGEAAKVVVLSVTEGDDKPLKYPDMFAASTLMVINKVDLLPYVDFDVARCIEAARRVNPDIDVLSVSATSGEGIDAWIDWLLLHRLNRESSSGAGSLPAAGLMA